MNKSLFVALGLLLISPAPVFARAAAAFSNQNVEVATMNVGTSKSAGTCNFKQMIASAEKGDTTVACIEGAIADLEKITDRQQLEEYRNLWNATTFDINDWLRKRLVAFNVGTGMVDYMIYLLDFDITTSGYYDEKGNVINKSLLPLDAPFETYHHYLSHADLRVTATRSIEHTFYNPSKYRFSLAWLAGHKSAFDEHPDLAKDILEGIAVFESRGFSSNAWPVRLQKALHKDAVALVNGYLYPQRETAGKNLRGGSGTGNDEGRGRRLQRGEPGGDPDGKDWGPVICNTCVATGRTVLE